MKSWSIRVTFFLDKRPCVLLLFKKNIAMVHNSIMEQRSGRLLKRGILSGCNAWHPHR